MRFLKKLLKSTIRACVWMVSFVSGVLVVFLIGYWMGWKFTPEEPSVEETGAQVGSVSSTEEGRVIQSRARTPQQRRETVSGLLFSEGGKRLDRIHLQARIAALDANDVLSFLTTLETAPASQMYLDLRQALLERWATLDPGGAFEYARSFSKKRESMELVSAVIRRWAFYDASAALEGWREMGFGESFEDRYDRGRDDFHGLQDIFSRLGRQDLNHALTELRTLLPEQQSAAWQALSDLAAGDEQRERLFTAILALPAGEVRSDALAHAVGTWSRSGHVEQALEWVDSASLGRDEKSKIEMHIAMLGFYDDNREQVADWLVARAQTPKERADRLNQMVMNWVHEDPVASGNWLIRQGLDEAASRAMATYARSVSKSHPADALAWARSIRDETVRQRALGEVEMRVRQYHPHKAEGLLAGGR